MSDNVARYLVDEFEPDQIEVGAAVHSAANSLRLAARVLPPRRLPGSTAARLRGLYPPSEVPDVRTAGCVYPQSVSAKSDRRAARETVGAYHEEQLSELVGHVKLAVERHVAGEIDAFAVDVPGAGRP